MPARKRLGCGPAGRPGRVVSADGSTVRPVIDAATAISKGYVVEKIGTWG